MQPTCIAASPIDRELLNRASQPRAGLSLELPAPQPQPLSVDPPHGIAVVAMRGEISKAGDEWNGGSYSTDFDAPCASTVEARDQLADAMEDSRVAGVLFVIDSQRGDVAGVSDLAADVRAAKKPVHAFIEDNCSGTGYWIASQAKRISCNQTALVGGLGMFALLYDYFKAYDRAGVTVHVMKAGKFKGAGTEGTAIDKDYRDEVQKLVDGFAGHFYTDVKRARRFNVANWTDVCRGGVYVGEQSQRVGLVDSIGSLDEAYAALQKAAGLK